MIQPVIHNFKIMFASDLGVTFALGVELSHTPSPVKTGQEKHDCHRW